MLIRSRLIRNILLNPITSTINSSSSSKLFRSISTSNSNLAIVRRNRSIINSKKVFKSNSIKSTSNLISPIKTTDTIIEDVSTSTPPATPPEIKSTSSLADSTPSTSIQPKESSESIVPTIPIETIPVLVPHDPQGVLDLSRTSSSETIRKLFAVPAIVVARQIELMNIFIGFEEANKYQLLSPEGELLGYLLEEDLGFKSMIGRQMLKTHRAFKATVISKEGDTLLIIRRPFSWINSRIYVSIPSPDATSESSEADSEIIIGEAQQEWHLYRRKYNHFLNREGGMEQFASTDSGFLAWDFDVQNEEGETIGSVNRNFAGFGRELFTDTGQYVLRFEGVVQEQVDALEAPSSPIESISALPTSSINSSTSSPTLTSTSSTSPPPQIEPISLSPLSPSLPPLSTSPLLTSPTAASQSSTSLTLPQIPSITYDQRAVLLASAISIDFDYFTRSRGGLMGGGGMGTGLWMPMPMGGLGGGGSAAAEGAGVEGAGGLMQGEEGEESGPLPSSDSGYGNSNSGDSDYGNEGGGSFGGNSNRENNWSNDEVMQDDAPMVDPWASTEQSGGGGDEGTWSWGDLFPDE